MFDRVVLIQLQFACYGLIEVIEHQSLLYLINVSNFQHVFNEFPVLYILENQSFAAILESLFMRGKNDVISVVVVLSVKLYRSLCFSQSLDVPLQPIYSDLYPTVGVTQTLSQTQVPRAFLRIVIDVDGK